MLLLLFVIIMIVLVIKCCCCCCSGTVECNEPILIVSMKLGICKVDPKGKDCNTTFMRLSYNGRTSVVRCKVFGPYRSNYL